MNTKTPLLLLATAFAALTACNPKDVIDPNEQPNVHVNSWIYNQMRMYYLWNETLPSKPMLEAYPADFFSSLLNPADRFSWIQDNYMELQESLSGVNSDIGFEYVGYELTTGSDTVLAQVAYVKPNTPAQAAGVRRGELFTKVNGVQLNKSNWRSLLYDSKTSLDITFVDSTLAKPYVRTLAKVSRYAEDPVFLDSVYNVGGKTIGYLVYNFFASDNGDESMSYDLKLNNVFGRFKSQNVTDLVLDLRYNGGGSMLSATTLSSMIVPGLSTQKVLTRLTFNKWLEAALVRQYGPEMLEDRFMDRITVGDKHSEPINNHGAIAKLHVLTGRWTASASELVINGLKPYMDVVIIGDTTVGKNVGSMTLYADNDPANKWGLQPIVLRYFNADGTSDFEDGFPPDLLLRDNKRSMLELGDTHEELLQAAIQRITGVRAARSIRPEAAALGRPLGSSVERKAWSGRAIVDNRDLRLP